MNIIKFPVGLTTARNFTTDPPCASPGICKSGPGANPGETCVNCPIDCGLCPVVNISTTDVGTTTNRIEAPQEKVRTTIVACR